jgi:hypothetical protein
MLMSVPHRAPRNPAEWIDLLRRVAESGLSGARFATEVLGRNPRSLYRWTNYESSIPDDVKSLLLDPGSTLPDS